MKRSVGTYAVLILLAAFSWWLAEQLLPKESLLPKQAHGKIDYYSTRVKRTVMSPEGKPKQLLFAETMTHYQDDDRTEMDKPVMTLYKEGKPPWIIHSETGTSLSGGSAVLLNGNVLITRETDDGGTIEIRTRNVKYDPNRDYAETQEDVIIRSPHDETHATGMQVYFEPELKAHLLANVRRKHEAH